MDNLVLVMAGNKIMQTRRYLSYLSRSPAVPYELS